MEGYRGSREIRRECCEPIYSYIVTIHILIYLISLKNPLMQF